MRAKELKAGALMIHAEPSAEGFYKRMGATGSAKGHFIILQSLYCLICSTSFLVDGSHVEDALLRYRLGCAARRSALPPERFSPLALRVISLPTSEWVLTSVLGFGLTPTAQNYLTAHPPTKVV